MGTNDLAGASPAGWKHAHQIVAASEDIADHICQSGVHASRLRVLPNWVTPEEAGPKTPNAESPAPESPGNSPPLRVLASVEFAGPDEEAVLQSALAALRKSSPDAAPEVLLLEESARARRFERSLRGNLPGSDPHSSLPLVAAPTGDWRVALIAQQESTVGRAIPQLAFDALTAGNPIVYIGPATSAVGRLVELENCGWRVPAGDWESLADLLARLQADPALLAAASAEVRRVARESYGPEKNISDFTEVFTP
jgi:glycosyltransferase involved in cell wall biosynthesis